MNLQKHTLGIALAILTALAMTASIVSVKAMQGKQSSGKFREKNHRRCVANSGDIS